MVMEEPPSYEAVVKASQAEIVGTSAPRMTASDTTVTVTDPVMQRGASGRQYTSYKVTTRTTNPKYKACNSGDAIVMRRFSEFHMLYTKLQEEYPGVIVPPCPEKNQMETFRMSSAFIEQRRQALEVFVNKVCFHRILKHSDLLRMFLEADETTWHIEMQKLKSPDSGGIFGKVSQFASDIVHSTKNLTKGQSDDQGESTEYLQYKEYATHLDHHLRDACGRSAEFVARQAAYGEALSSFATQVHNMSKLEDGPAATAFIDLHSAAVAIAHEHSVSQAHMNRIFAAPMKEQHLAIRSLKDTMHARSCALSHKAQSEASVQAARTRLTSIRATGKPEVVIAMKNEVAKFITGIFTHLKAVNHLLPLGTKESHLITSTPLPKQL